MKAYKYICFVFLATTILFFNGCATTTSKQQSYGSVSDVNNAVVKDFEVKGIIFLKSTAIEKVDIRGREVVKGSRITYEMLMKEAQNLGADDIMNLRIDEEVLPTKNKFDPIKEIKYTATAIAIKYTNAIPVPVTTHIEKRNTYINQTVR
ncbi:MAG: hypothetical protein FWF00_01395 [Endomicrobia bacterium]|nr:hypothetical protein [Endomicrobiia bacterium]MCL2506330.1 hypothetical protein [Endomicrobiia bacterium]